MKIIDLPAGWRPRAVVIAEGSAPRAWFTDEEMRTADSFRLHTRRNEFLLSRAAAKTLAVGRGLATDPKACVITGRRIGSHFLSLSHSAPYAAAAIDSSPVGIDVQVVRDISERAAHLFLSDAEIATMQRCTLADRMIHFWCAKEAEWKREGGAYETLRRVPLHLQEIEADGLRFDGVQTVRIGDAIVALTMARRLNAP